MSAAHNWKQVRDISNTFIWKRCLRAPAVYTPVSATTNNHMCVRSQFLWQVGRGGQRRAMTLRCLLSEYHLWSSCENALVGHWSHRAPFECLRCRLRAILPSCLVNGSWAGLTLYESLWNMWFERFARSTSARHANANTLMISLKKKKKITRVPAV